MASMGYSRFTEDIDILLSHEGLDRFKEKCLGLGYTSAFPGAEKSFKDAKTGVRIEVIVAGEFPGDGKPKAISFPRPEDVSIVTEGVKTVPPARLIELKLASGMSAPHRMRDLADVQDLILRLDLPKEKAQELDESVREEFLRLWQGAQAGSM